MKNDKRQLIESTRAVMKRKPKHRTLPKVLFNNNDLNIIIIDSSYATSRVISYVTSCVLIVLLFTTNIEAQEYPWQIDTVAADYQLTVDKFDIINDSMYLPNNRELIRINYELAEMNYLYRKVLLDVEYGMGYNFADLRRLEVLAYKYNDTAIKNFASSILVVEEFKKTIKD